MDEQCSRGATRGRTAHMNPRVSSSRQREGGRLYYDIFPHSELQGLLKVAPGQGTLRVMDSQSQRCPSWKGLRMGTFLQK